MRRNLYYIWPITLLELKYKTKYIFTSARNAAAIAKGMVELRSLVFYSGEERGSLHYLSKPCQNKTVAIRLTLTMFFVQTRHFRLSFSFPYKSRPYALVGAL